MLPNCDFDGLYAEMVSHFSNLIRIDTTNPPGNEIEAVRYLADLFNKEGIGYEIVEPDKGRASIVARIKGNSAARPLLLMSHLDVVGVEPDKWRVPPFSGKIVGNCLWGRGALDCKNTAVLWLMILIAIKRSGWQPKRDLIFLGAADEETGGQYGAKWIVKNRFDLVAAEAALNEGGGFCIELMGQTFYTYQTAEKGNLWLKITSRGAPGHASVPHGDNSVSHLIELVGRLQNLTMKFSVTKTVRQMIQIMAHSQRFPLNLGVRQLLNPLLSETIIRRSFNNKTVAAAFKAMLRNTISPTVLQAGQKVNVIPSVATAEVDIRVLPGFDMQMVLNRVKELTGHSFEVEVTDLVHPSESVLDHALANCIKAAIRNKFPQALAIPLLSTGSSDSGFFRDKGVVVYGFSPLLPREEIFLAHAHDEKISLDSIRFSLEVGLQTVYDFIA
jgi:acetylornithine deacetylase/succinyl-diaminopimelate desuccinylase-like protein